MILLRTLTPMATISTVKLSDGTYVTRVFGGKFDRETKVSATEVEAREGHEAWVRRENKLRELKCK